MSEPAQAKPNPPLWRTALFALPGAPLLALSVPPIVFLPRYYSTELGVDAGIVGIVFLAARLFDVIVNPTIGMLQDTTRTAYGRRRVWLACATPVLMAIVWFAFIGMPPNVGALFVGLTVMSLYITFAAAMIAHLGWAGEVSSSYHGRTRVLGAVQIAGALGQVAMMATPAVVQMSGLGDFADGVHIMGWLVIASLPICAALAIWAMPENPAPAPAQAGSSGVQASFRALMESAILRRVLAPDLLIGIVQGMAGTLFLFYADFALNIEREATSLLFLYFFSGLIAIPFWVWLGRRIGKHAALAWSCVIWGAAFAAIPIVPPNAPELLAIGMAVAGFPSTAGTLLVRSMMADAVDDDEARTGEQRSGLYFGLLLTTSKIGLAVGPASLAILRLFGFDGDAETQTPLALAALTWMYCATPVVLMALTFLSLRNYPLDEEKQRQLRAQIEARRAAAQAPAE